MCCKCKVKTFKIAIIVALLCLATTAKAQKITIYVDKWPPYQFVNNGNIVGISVDLIEQALKNANVEYSIIVFPFKRALRTVQETPNTMLFTVARIPKREDNFLWIGPIYPRIVFLYKLQSRTDIKIYDVEDIKKYVTGILSGGSVEQLFRSKGFAPQEYTLVNKSDLLLKMLLAERVDLIPGDPLDMAYQMKVQGKNFSRLEIAYFLADEGDYYMVANKNISHELIEKIQKSLDELLATGFREQLIKQYLE